MNRYPPAAVVLLALLGCSRPAPQAVPLRVAVHSDPLALDPHQQNEVLTHALLANVFDALTGFDADGRVRPNLASWENPDELTYRFHLRPGVRFHNNRPVEAEDVLASLERARSHPRSQLRSYLVEVETLRALDPQTVEVRTRRPLPVLLNRLAFVYIVPRDAPAEISEPIGSGSYRLAAYTRGKRLLLQPFEGDWRKPAPGQPLEFQISADAQQRVDLLLAGQVDIAYDLPPRQVARVKARHDCRVLERTSSTVEYLHFSSRDARFADKRLRLAIHLALDRRLLVERNFLGHAEPASQLVNPGVFGFDPALRPAERELARARELLAEVGPWPGPPLKLECRLGRDASEIARQLGEAGLAVVAESTPWPELYARLRRREIPFYYGGVGATTGDASDVLQAFLHSADAARGYGTTNNCDYSNPAVDALIEESSFTSDLMKRRQLLQRSMRLAMDDLYLLPLVSPRDIYGVRADIQWRPRQDRLLLGREMRRLAR